MYQIYIQKLKVFKKIVSPEYSRATGKNNINEMIGITELLH
jgi:hypothetical protein